MHRPVRFSLLLICLFLVGTAVPHAHAQQTIADARASGVGETVTVTGTVTRALGDFVRFQDDSGPTGASGLVVRQVTGVFYDDVQNGVISAGTQIQVEGTLSEFNGLLQINEDDLAAYTVQGQGEVPTPQSVTLADLRANGEDYESELVTLTELRLDGNIGTFGSDATYDVVQGQDTTPFDLRIQGADESELGGTPAPPATFTYTGILGQFDFNTPATTGYQLIPVRTSDIQAATFFAFGDAYRVSEEADGTVSVDVQAVNVPDGQTVEVTVQASGTGTADASTDLTSGISPSTLTFTGPDPAPQAVSYSFAADGTTEGVEYLSLELSSPDGPGAANFTQWILDDPTSQGPIASGLESTPLLDELEAAFGNPATIGYTAARDTMYRVIYNEGGVVEGFYSGYRVPVDPNGGDASSQALDGGINTEHIFPQSLGAGDEPARSNMHILVPAREQVNSARSNYPYADIPDSETDTWFFEAQSQGNAPTSNIDAWSELNDSPADRDLHRFEPREAVKGDVARAVFYFMMSYPDRATRSFFVEQKSTLLQWHTDDPVDATEMRRNVLQASYQDNKLNPFVIDPTLVDRAFGVIGAPTDIVSAAGNDTVQLRWREPLSGDVAGYNVYRSSTSFSSPGEAQKVNASLITGTTYTDVSVQVGGSYVYRITAVDASDAESGLSDAVEAVVYPSSLTLSIDRPFGDLAAPESYRLVALPGDVDAALGANLGDPSTDWSAFWDDGSDTDFLVRFDGSDTFQFQPGRGFWLVSTDNWTVETSVPSVPLVSGSVTIPLHEGWNIISNPLPIDVAWSDVQAANAGTLQPLWQWDGAFAEAAVFGSAAAGEAFYFLNDDGLSELTIPLQPAPKTAQKQRASARTAYVQLEAVVDGEPVSRISAGQHAEAADGRDRFDHVAPPTSFSGTALRLISSSASARERFLTRDVRSVADGQSYRVRLDATTAESLTLSAATLPAGPDTQVFLVNEATGKRHDLRASSVVVNAPPSTSNWTLLVGSKSFVAGETQDASQELTIEPPSPNPFRDYTTMQYVLPEAADVSVHVYDILGRRIATLADRRQTAGQHTLRWNGTGSGGAPTASGMYFIRMTIGDAHHVHKVVRIR